MLIINNFEKIIIYECRINQIRNFVLIGKISHDEGVMKINKMNKKIIKLKKKIEKTKR